MNLNSNKFNAAHAYAAFKKIRNRLRKHDPQEIVFMCINKLNSYDRTSISQLRQSPPWYILLLIKWSVIHGDYLSPDRRAFTTKDFATLLNLIHSLNGSVRLPSHYDNNFLFFRNIIYQQIWLQERNFPRFARQSLLFGNLASEHPFHDTFSQQTGITIKQFIQLGYCTFAKFFEKKEPFIKLDWFRSLHDAYSPNTVDRFLSMLSHDFESLKLFLKENHSKYRDVSYEFHEKTPLKQYPLLRFQDKFFCYSRELLFESLNDYIYDTLRAFDSEAFMNKFGKMFEVYVEGALSYSGADYCNEESLRKKLKANSKVVDFIILSEDTSILIDAKGVELAVLGMLSHKTEVIIDKCRSSIIKAITQVYETASNLASNPNTYDLISNKELFLLVITFKDLYVGNGIDFYHDIAKVKIDEIVQKHDNKKWIAFDHMYFCLLMTLNYLLSVVVD